VEVACSGVVSGTYPLNVLAARADEVAQHAIHTTASSTRRYATDRVPCTAHPPGRSHPNPGPAVQVPAPTLLDHAWAATGIPDEDVPNGQAPLMASADPSPVTPIQMAPEYGIAGTTST